MARKKKVPYNGKPELSDGYMPIANELVDQFIKLKLTPAQWNIVFLVMRETYGYNRKSKDLSVSYIAKAIGVSSRKTRIAVQDLISRKILVEYSEPTPRASRTIGVNKYYLEWFRGDRKVPSEVTYPSPDRKVPSEVTQESPLEVTQRSPKQKQYKDTSKDNKPAADNYELSDVEHDRFDGW